MVIVHTYLKASTGNIVASVTFSYNNEEEEVTSRELIVDLTEDSDYESIKSEVAGILEKEKVTNGEFTIDLPSGMSGFIGVEQGY